MKSFNSTKEIIGNLKPEHLIEGVSPIMACIEERSYFTDEIYLMIESAKNIDYYENSVSGQEDFLNSKNKKGYVISGIDSEDKYTNMLYGCTSVVCVGISKDTGEEISFLTHQDPDSIIKDSDFTKDLKQRFVEMKERCIAGTVDIVIAGGFSSDIYDKYIPLLDDSVNNVFGFSPVVISGPKKSGFYDAYDGVYFDIKNRRLYVIRPLELKKYNEPFRADDLDMASGKWKDNPGEFFV